ncbi:MAG: hypothetical protein WC533_03635 [Candidatus Pacearchaeota archaeon]
MVKNKKQKRLIIIIAVIVILILAGLYLALKNYPSLSPWTINIPSGQSATLNLYQMQTGSVEIGGDIAFEVFPLEINVYDRRAKFVVTNILTDKSEILWITVGEEKEITAEIVPVKIKLNNLERWAIPLLKKRATITISELVIPETCGNGFCQGEETKKNCNKDCRCHTTTKIGDLNQDNVGFEGFAIDVAIIGALVEDRVTIKQYPCGDVNNDGKFDALDIAKLADLTCSMNGNCGYWPMQ